MIAAGLILLALDVAIACNSTFSTLVNSQRPVPLRRPASLAAHHWGTFILHDLEDNGLLDASILYGISPAIKVAMMDTSGAKFRLTAAGTFPLVCAPIIPRTAGLFPDDSPCCGVCGESPGLLAVFTTLAHIHNSAIVGSVGEATVTSLLRQTCPTCSSSSPAATAALRRYYATSLLDSESSGTCSALQSTTKTGAFGRRITDELAGGCPSNIEAAIAESPGPGEDDVLGAAGRALFLAGANVTEPEWLWRDDVERVMLSECETESETGTDGSKEGGCKTKEGSMIFFTILMGILVVVVVVTAFLA